MDSLNNPKILKYGPKEASAEFWAWDNTNPEGTATPGSFFELSIPGDSYKSLREAEIAEEREQI
jgi:hypothetical protein